MPRLHLHVSEEIAAEVKRRAKRRGISTSRYLAEMVQREVADEWPDGFFEHVIGGWQGAPLHRPEQLTFEQRDGTEPNTV